MATPMFVFVEIASRYGIDPENDDAVNAFFNTENNSLSVTEQIDIMEELVRRDGEQNVSEYRIS